MGRRKRAEVSDSKRRTKRPATRKPKSRTIVAVDLFCGAGGLTRGLLDAGIRVVAGYDIDEICRFPYEHNNAPVVFKRESVSDITARELQQLYPTDCWRVLVGCAPCQPFSRYTQGFHAASDEKWGLLRHFAGLVEDLKPHVVSMENVPELQRHRIFHQFVKRLKAFQYEISFSVVFCPDYGIPQQRSRLVLFASRLGSIKITPPTHTPDRYLTVRSAIRHLPTLAAGKVSPEDALHRSSNLSPLNRRRVRASHPGGTWRDWDPALRAHCHRKKKGKTYPSVYGRMEWDSPSPTITTQFFGFGNGRFGHPEDDRAISLREGAVLQTFPRNYQFVEEGGKYYYKRIGRLIGNAVPVRLGEVIGNSIKAHLGKHE
ncbi:MAG: DNA cytosine methyltransferase [Sedimentisphaerales bacterium]|nr:DNA cytosine methyltransferase [Sedimentisphaerales bacterium]